MLISHPDFFTLPSDQLDKILGFNVKEIEEDLLRRARLHNPDGTHKTWGQGIHDGNQTWVGLEPQTLQTPYSELKQMCDLLNPTESEIVVDLGAGYGRLGIVLGQLYPEVKFYGYEYVKERVKEGERILDEFQFYNAKLIEQDLVDENFKLPEADYYFVYDYGTLPHIRQTLKLLEEMGDKRNFKVIGRGQGTRSLIQYEHPWLSQVHDPHHEENFSIYSMCL